MALQDVCSRRAIGETLGCHLATDGVGVGMHLQ